MKIHIEIMTPEGAIMAAKVSAAIAAAMNGTAVITTGTRTRRTAAEIAADKASEAQPPVAEKPDAAAQYEAMLAAKDPQPASDTTSAKDPASDTAPALIDPLEALGASPTASTKPRDEMIAAITKVMGEKGVVWTRENIIVKHKVGKFSEMSDELVAQIHGEVCP